MKISFTDLSDTERPITTPPQTSTVEVESRQQALNYSTLAAAAAANVPNGGQDSSLSSTETLLRNIQGLLKVAADNSRQQERQISFEKGKRNVFFSDSLSLSCDHINETVDQGEVH